MESRSLSSRSFRFRTQCKTVGEKLQLFAVGHPNVLYLNGMVEEPASFTLSRGKPVDGAAFAGAHPFQISNRYSFCQRRAGLVGETLDGVHFIVLCGALCQLGSP